MTDNSAAADPADDVDIDSEPTMTAPPEGRPDGAVPQEAGADEQGVHAQDADDQTGSESTEG